MMKMMIHHANYMGDAGYLTKEKDLKNGYYMTCAKCVPNDVVLNDNFFCDDCWKLTLLTYQIELSYIDFAKVMLKRVYNIYIMSFCHAFYLEMGFFENFQCCLIVARIFKCIFWSCKTSLKQNV